MRGKQVVNFSISRAKGASDVTVYDEAMKKLEEIEKENPGVKFTQLFTSVDYTKQQYSSSMLAMIEGAVLAVLVVFLFLRDIRATVISALAIPLSAIPAFWFMDLMGFTLNSLSLLALGLVAGVLVDDAIVEIENIVRHMRMGKSAYQASIDAADEIGLAVARDDHVDRRRLPAGGADARHFRPVLQELRLHGRARGADQPVRRAHDHADDRGLFPEGARARHARRRLADGPLHGHPALVAGLHQGQADQGQRAAAAKRAATCSALMASSNLVAAGHRRLSVAQPGATRCRSCWHRRWQCHDGPARRAAGRLRRRPVA